MIHRVLKVFEGSSPQDIEDQVNTFSEKNGMVPFSINVIKSNEGLKTQKYKAFVVFENYEMSSSDFGKDLN